MRFTILTLALLLSLSWVINVSAEPVRDFTLPDMNDRPFSLSSILGEQIIIIDFWATWCAPCMRLMPELEKIHKENDDITVLMISIDNPRAVSRAKSHIRSQKFTMTALFDTNREISNRFQVTDIPHTFVIGYDGSIIYEHTGYVRGDEEELLEKIIEYRQSLIEVVE